MWMPTHVNVTVIRGADLLTKGKNNTNDCFVTIGLGKTKYQTSVKKNASPSVEWREECELPIPDQGNTAELVLTAYHHSFVDEFLGRVKIPLNSLEIYERPKNKWYTLESKNKPGKETKHKERGRLEVKIGFIVKSGSLTDLSKKEKHKSSIGQLSAVAQSVGGSLLSLGSVEKRKGIKKFAKSIGSKMVRGKKKDGDFDDGGSSIGSVGSLKIRSNTSFDKFKSKQTMDDADPGVVSEDDDFNFDDLSHKSSASSLSQNLNGTTTSLDNVSDSRKVSSPPAKPPRQEPKAQDEWESKLFGNKSKTLLKPGSSESLNRRSWDSSKLSSQIEEEDPADLLEVSNAEDSISAKVNKTPEPVKKDEKEGMFSKFKHFRKEKNELDTKLEKRQNAHERIVIGGENEMPVAPINNRISNELLQKFEGKTREDLILSLCDTQLELDKQKKKLKDLEDYLDDLLLRVMETQPKILQNPYVTCKIAHSKFS
ncbi:rab11 family-interacting protein 2 isoform X3 [Aethina tumida]|nr:rab11 family-interacting protein 2 isoform X3 [Aethina tumida]